MKKFINHFSQQTRIVKAMYIHLCIAPLLFVVLILCLAAWVKLADSPANTEEHPLPFLIPLAVFFTYAPSVIVQLFAADAGGICAIKIFAKARQTKSKTYAFAVSIFLGLATYWILLWIFQWAWIELAMLTHPQN